MYVQPTERLSANSAQACTLHAGREAASARRERDGGSWLGMRRRRGPASSLRVRLPVRGQNHHQEPDGQAVSALLADRHASYVPVLPSRAPARLTARRPGGLRRALAWQVPQGTPTATH